jgi:hypothetical protein
MQLGFSQEQQRRWLDDNHAAVQAKVPDPIVAYQVFYRTGSWGQLGAAHILPVAGTVMKMVGKRRAGGLPQSFMLVLTATRLYAFKYKSRTNGIKMGDQLAVWERDAISYSVEDTKITKRLTFESRSDGARIVVDTGKAYSTDLFLGELGAALPIAA